MSKLFYNPAASNYLDVELKDDETQFGGISFSGETLRDFLDETETNYETPMLEVNRYLKQCGIKPIQI